tara:strand:- start:11962 stop:13545 length:1584 start_codon:yes stop_codon:yes gene_type:complete
MSGAIVTDQFRVSNAENFVNSFDLSTNSYYLFVGLANPAEDYFGRSTSWNVSTPSPKDDFSNTAHTKDTIIFGKKITSVGLRRLVKKRSWVSGTKYEMYRDDYNSSNRSPITNSSRLYDTSYYVITSEFKVYICIDNGSSGDNLTGNPSIDEPRFTGLEPAAAGSSGDGYLWKYLFTIDPTDVIKFDSTDYIPLPNNWNTTDNEVLKNIRENGNSDVNNNQIKKVYIANKGSGYSGSGVCDILGDGTGGKVQIEINGTGEITSATITKGGSGYSYGIVDLDPFNESVFSDANINNHAELIPIIPPSKGHGYDIYQELGADKILLYVRFDGSTKDFPTTTKFSQIGLIKNPKKYGVDELFTDSQFNGLHAVRLSTTIQSPIIGEIIEQSYTDNNSNSVKARGYVASYDDSTRILKYYQDRSLYFADEKTHRDNKENRTIETRGVLPIVSTGGNISFLSTSQTSSVDSTLNGSTMTVDGSVVDLGVSFTDGIAAPEINKNTGEILYLDNRPVISRNTRQKEDIKVILEF